MKANSINNRTSSLGVDQLFIDDNTISCASDISLNPVGTGNLDVQVKKDLPVITVHSENRKFMVMDYSSGSFGFLSSHGSPEGVVAGNVGAWCTDIDEGIIYIKKADPGDTTGWILLGGKSNAPTTIVSNFTSETFTVSSSLNRNRLPKNTDGVKILSATIEPKSIHNILSIKYTVSYYRWNVDPTVFFLVTKTNPKALNVILLSHLLLYNTGSVTGLFSMVAGTTSPIEFTVRGSNESSLPITINPQWSDSLTRSSIEIQELLP
jgi:hypothetical protein